MKAPEMQLPLERSNLGLIEEHRHNLFHELSLIVYPEGSAMRKPRDCLCEVEKVIGQLEHGVDLDWEFRLCSSGRVRGG